MSVIDELLALQKQDAIIKDLQRQVADIPKRRGKEEGTNDGFLHEFEQARANVEDGEARIRAIEDRIADHDAEIAKWEKVRAGLKSEAELRGMNAQIEHAQRDRKDDEVRLETARGFVEDARAAVSAAEARYNESNAATQAYIASLNKKLAETQKELLEAQAARGALVAPLSSDPAKARFLQYYERQSRRYWPVVVVVDSTTTHCPGCHMAITASKRQEAVSNSLSATDPSKMKTVACENCGRLLFSQG